MTKNYSRCHFDFDSLPWLTSPRHQLDLHGVALGLIHLPPDEGYTFTHSHRKQEEVYMVIKGGGLLQIDKELLQLNVGDFVRVSPEASRALKADDRGLFVICCGGVPQGYPDNPRARYLIDDGIPDYQDIPSWYRGDTQVVEKNKLLHERLLRSRKKREAVKNRQD